MSMTVVTMEKLQRFYDGIKTLLGKKQNTITGAASSVVDTDLAKSVALATNGRGKISATEVTATELSYLKGAKSNLQKQIDGLSVATTNYVSATPSIPNKKATQIAKITLSKGQYLIVATGEFLENAKGSRMLRLSDSTTGDSGIDRFSTARFNAVTDEPTKMQVFAPISISSSSMTVYLFAEQSSGAALSMRQIGIYALKLR